MAKNQFFVRMVFIVKNFQNIPQKGQMLTKELIT